MRRMYLIYAFTAFLAWMILNKMEYQAKWIAIGFGAVMLLFGLFLKEKNGKTKKEIKKAKAEAKAEEVINEINNMGKNKEVSKK